MNAKKILLSTIIAVLMLLPAQAFASTWTSMPGADWSYTDPNTKDYYDEISQFSAQIRNNNLYYFSNDKIHIIDTKTGKHKGSIDYLKNSNMRYSFFGTLSEIDSKGNVYAMTATKNSAGVYLYKLTAYNDTGKKLWEKAYNEKIRSIAGVLTLNNGSIVTYLETGSEKFTTYTYDAKGQLKEKKEWKSYVNGYQNGYFITVNVIGKQVSKFSFYDDSMKLKFSLNVDFNDGSYYSGITPEGLVIFCKYNSTTKKTTYYAKDSTGKKVWSKEFAGQAGRDSLYDHHHPGEGSFKNWFGGTVGDKFFLIDRKGNAQQLPYGDFYFQTASDQTVMLLHNSKLDIYQASNLSLLHSVNLSDANKKDQYLYAGSGIVYRIDEKNVISRINIANPAIGIYLNGDKQSFAIPPQNMNNTIMVPLRDVVEALGGKIVSSQNNEINLQFGDKKIAMQVNQSKATINGKSYTLNQAPVSYRNTTLVPIRFFSEALGAKVKWVQAENSVYIEM